MASHYATKKDTPPMGHLYLCSTTSTNPASMIFCFDSSTTRRVFPKLSPHWMEISPHWCRGSPGFTVPSSDLGTTLPSTCSIQPPGLRCLANLSIHTRGEKLGLISSLHNLLVECRPVGDAAIQAADVDKIEALPRVQPFLCTVTYLELKVGWNIGWLNWGQICSNH
jgi:hypothetical protein